MNIEDSGSNADRVPLAAERLKKTERSEQIAQFGGKAGDQSHPLRYLFPHAGNRCVVQRPGDRVRSLRDAAGKATADTLRSLILLLALFALVSTTSCTRHHLSDTPAARRELARSVVGYEDQKIAGRPWIDYASARTAYLIPGDDVQSPERGVFVLDPLRGAGRGAALTRDGYYLTANHVVDATDNPGLLDFSRAPGVHRGRVVKRFEAADLALVKFDFRPRAWFSDWLEAPTKGDHVFAAAATDQWQQEPLSGNGGFEASGDAIEILPIRGGEAYGAKAAKTTLPARGGMSGAPLVDGKGRLVGIMLESRDAPLRPPGFKISVSGMISPKVLEKLVKEDRRGKR